MIDLEKDKEEFFKYTLKWAMMVELLLEDHLSELEALGKYIDDSEKFKQVWNEAKFCQECIVNHSLEEAGFANECVTTKCPALPDWKELFNTASEMYDYFSPLTKMEDYTKEVFRKAGDFNSRLRSVRKKLEEAGMEFVAKDGYKDDGKEHLT